MHVGLNKVLAVEDQSPIPEPLTDSAQLKHFAREAEVNGNFELAAKYYQEVSYYYWEPLYITMHVYCSSNELDAQLKRFGLSTI